MCLMVINLKGSGMLSVKENKKVILEVNKTKFTNIEGNRKIKSEIRK